MTLAPLELGPVYTRGTLFRARAEARQREYRARELKVGCSRHGHILDDESASAGRNFVRDDIHRTARARAAAGKGVAAGTFNNMLSSQAMCFNVFAPLEADLDLASAVLGPLLGVAKVGRIVIEHTPMAEIFRDQGGRGGVDCDVLIEATDRDAASVVVVIETKFVEPDFSTCSFRDRKRLDKDKPYCPDEIAVSEDHRQCLYSARKSYAYWERSAEFATLARDKLPVVGCPFAGPEWQLWVNHTLARAEAAQRGAARAVFAVCAPASNEALLRGGILDCFQARLANRDTFRFLPLDDLLGQIRKMMEREPNERRNWASALSARYGAI
jgi:hypothetical protein